MKATLQLVVSPKKKTFGIPADLFSLVPPDTSRFVNNSTIVVEDLDTGLYEQFLQTVERYYIIDAINYQVPKPISIVEGALREFRDAIYHKIYLCGATSAEAKACILSARLTFAMKYTPRVPLQVSPGDIVSCTFGYMLPNEPNGGYVHSLVCDVDEQSGRVFVIPITKEDVENDQSKFISFKAIRDVVYTKNPKKYPGGTLVLTSASYVSIARISDIVGKANEPFFATVLNILPSIFDFSHNTEYNIFSEDVIDDFTIDGDS